MRRIARILIIIAIVVLGIGFYRGWFGLSSSRNFGNNKIDVHLTVDPDQVKSDAKQASSVK